MQQRAYTHPNPLLPHNPHPLPHQPPHPINTNTTHNPPSQQADPAELAELARAFDLPRDDAVRRGIALGGARFEVHRHHPEGEEGDGLGLIYGRTMGGGAAGGGHSHGGGEGDHDGPAGANGVYGAKAWSEGAAVCRVKPSRAPGGAALFGAATYALPQVSARMVPLLRDACERLLGPGKQQG